MSRHALATFVCLIPFALPAPAQDGATQEPQDPEIQSILAAEGEARVQRLVTYLEKRFQSNAIFAGQYASLRGVGPEVVTTLTAWAQKAPKQTRLGDRFRLTCVRAMRDVAETPSAEVLGVLETLADDIIEDGEIRNEAVYALAQFGKKERVEKQLARLRKDAESENVITRAQAHNQLASVFYNLRDYAKAVEQYEALIKVFESGKLGGFAGQGVILYNCACSLALSGQVERAFQRLEQALETNRKDGGNLDRTLLETDRDIAVLRRDERFAGLVEKYFPSKEGGGQRP